MFKMSHFSLPLLVFLFPILIQSENFSHSDLLEGEDLHIIYHNGPIKEISDGLDFSKVKCLQISHSIITDVDEQIFRSFPNLEYLSIFNTSIAQTKEQDILSHCCPKLKDLSICNWIGFEEYNLQQISTLPLETLSISYQTIPVLKSNTLKLSKLQELTLIDDGIEEIEADAFIHLTELKILKLWNNNVEYISKETLSPLKNLEALRIIDNGLKRFSTKELPQLPNLIELYITFEDMDELYLEGIETLAPKLEDIYLYGVRGVEIPVRMTPPRIHAFGLTR